MDPPRDGDQRNAAQSFHRRAAFAPQKPCEPDDPKLAVRRLYEQLGGVKRAAIRLGLKKSRTYDLADVDDDAAATWAQICALTGPEATAAAEYLALLAGGVFLPVPPPGSAIAELTAETLREYGEASADLVEKLAGGLTADEAAAALAPLDGALRAVVRLRQAVSDVATGRPSASGRRDVAVLP